MWRSKASAVTLGKGWRRLMPAALTRMSIVTCRACQRRRSTAVDTGGIREIADDLAPRSPSACKRLAALGELALRRAVDDTRAPARPSARAIARPMPELPPVTSAVRPVRSKSGLRAGTRLSTRPACRGRSVAREIFRPGDRRPCAHAPPCLRGGRCAPSRCATVLQASRSIALPGQRASGTYARRARRNSAPRIWSAGCGSARKSCRRTRRSSPRPRKSEP